uniref:two-partner secretion domain-containing protein n=1 Tax=Xanthomonas oryzae TaxID=347 RepID=UPI003DA0D9DA
MAGHRRRAGHPQRGQWTASRLNGYVEVAGQRAEVIIANPAGIQVDGGGFLNASRVTLTTGTPILSGGALEGYRVSGGAIQIGGAGLDTSRADYTDLITRSLQVNAGIWANQLQATLGNNVVSADHRSVATQAADGRHPRSRWMSARSAACSPTRSGWSATNTAWACAMPAISVRRPANWWSPSMAGSKTPVPCSRSRTPRSRPVAESPTAAPSAPRGCASAPRRTWTTAAARWMRNGCRSTPPACATRAAR